METTRNPKALGNIILGVFSNMLELTQWQKDELDGRLAEFEAPRRF